MALNQEASTIDTLAQLRAGRLAGNTRLDLRAGLTEFPREIFELADSLEVLNLTGNRLKELPHDLARLKKLRILFCSENEFAELPPALGECAGLGMIGFKANRIEKVEGVSLPESLRWLILTDNRIKELPSALGRCTRLQKLMLSGNRLTDLPEEMAACASLELIRLAANEVTSLPSWLLELPRLSWLAFAGNPCATVVHSMPKAMTGISWSDLHLQQKLGEGASGEIHRALWQKSGETESEAVAVKIFKGAVTSDGLPACELEACLAAGAHDHLIPVQGRVMNHPQGADGLVMSLMDSTYTNLAGPPDFESCTRDVYPEHLRFAPTVALSLACGIASVAAHLHSRGIVHGDLYAHNVLWNAQGRCCLGDFGAATFYDLRDSALAGPLQGIEVRAFGCLLEELLQRGAWTPKQQEVETALWRLQSRCVLPEVRHRPTFAEVTQELLRRAADLSMLQEASAPAV